MRASPVPLLRDLPSGCPIVRCFICNELVRLAERCADAAEARTCPSRDEVDSRPVPIIQEATP